MRFRLVAMPALIPARCQPPLPTLLQVPHD